MSSRAFVCALVALALTACTPASPGGEPPPSRTGSDPNTGTNGGDPGTGGDPKPGGDPTTSPTTVPEFAECYGGVTCATGLTCSVFEDSRRTYCLKGCTSDATCAAGERCSFGTCRRVIEPYGVFTSFDDCGPAGYPYKVSPIAPLRCMPICDVGDLSGAEAVAVCPPLPAGLHGSMPVCTYGVVPTLTAAFCTSEVWEGEVCDQASLRCNVGRNRPDTNAAQGPNAAGVDVGALACLPHSGESRCQRVCAVGTSGQSPCGCAGDPLCSEPTDPGVAWTCASWAEVAGVTGNNTYACVPLEPCSNDAACADNVASGTTRCGPSPYTPGVPTVCQRP